MYRGNALFFPINKTGEFKYSYAKGQNLDHILHQL